ncbi:hypothetical protein GLOTRDRAFT_118131 [Gloeophyllum trabeum ATCC 11539]|uniref:Arrestin-like N-terminal domain-containing protein n=1 Tax=Gloeophyllum trabeum (strain ATCC 11539 / FP-39264 / Madison 617) TaxID=670483 RepID=S7PUW2_GLOTA|nr:uncharacterized protein GLOTRDRAFT_118131 [Gloeophyllum trabeum ATCC 11539]EPQ51092.1 hypothetical protein GLOTRDRAFT_118131 [Gloeophyllum trabeum ATCC 11539]
MSTASLPSYTPVPEHLHTPVYSELPQPDEYRLAVTNPPRSRSHSRQRPAAGGFVKQSKIGGVSLRLAQQDGDASMPEYGCGSSVDGEVTISKTDGVQSVEVKIEGFLQLKEIAEGGTTSVTLCSEKTTLWSKRSSSEPGSCPSTLRFSLTIPTTFSDSKGTYPLPPTYEVHLSGLPGFRANIDYSVSVTVYRSGKSSLLGLASAVNIAKAPSLPFGLGNTTLSTPFLYIPRTRPAVPLPPPLQPTPDGYMPTADWKLFQGTLQARTKGGKDIISKLFLPASRIFCLSEPIPFHVTFASSAFSLAAFMPYGPIVSLLSPTRTHTRIELLRQATCDVRNDVVNGTKTDMWRTDRIGEGVFQHAGDGPDWISFSGQITINPDIKVGGFKAGGLHVKDCIVLSMVPPDPKKSPFVELRQVVPIRLTTDSWSVVNPGMTESEYSVPSNPEDYVEAQPELGYYQD